MGPTANKIQWEDATWWEDAWEEGLRGEKPYP
jgi:hypothetical protein